MIVVLGNSTKKLEIKDLEDVVYYKQQKSYTDSDYDRSLDLKREIKSGRLIVLKQSKDTTPSNSDFSIEHSTSASINEVVSESQKDPIIIEKEVIREVPAKNDESKIDMLLEKIISLEKRISESPEEDKNSLMEQFMAGVNERLEQRLSGINSINTEPAPEKEKPVDNNIDSKIDMLINLIQSGAVSSGPRSNVGDYTSPRSSDEVYIPNIKVEDANAKINLKTRVVESGSQVSNALDALKALKNNK